MRDGGLWEAEWLRELLLLKWETFMSGRKGDRLACRTPFRYQPHHRASAGRGTRIAPEVSLPFLSPHSPVERDSSLHSCLSTALEPDWVGEFRSLSNPARPP